MSKPRQQDMVAAKQTHPAVLTGTVEEQTSPQGLLAYALHNGADMETIKQLMDLRDRDDKHQARKAYVRDMAAFKENPPEILKKKLVSFKTNDGKLTQYMHAELGDVCEAIVSTMAKHGFSHRWDIAQKERVEVTCIITHRDGHSESVMLHAAPDDSGKKNTIQQVASTVTYLQRYTLLAATGLSTQGIDDDGQGSEREEPPTVTADQALEIEDLAKLAQADIPAFLKLLDNAPSFAEIYAKDYGRAKAMLNQKIKHLEKEGKL